MEEQPEKKRKTNTTTSVESLPEEIIQHIQSILPLKDASRTRLLSKPWLRAWSTNPTLRFGQNSSRMSPEFIKLVDDTLKRYHRNNLLIEQFHLYMRDPIYSDSVLDSWLNIIASKSNGLKELHLYLRMDCLANRMSYSLPSGILPSRTLEKLTLWIWYKPAKFVISCDDILKSHSLETVHLHNVHIQKCFGPPNSYDINDDHRCQNLKFLWLYSVTIDDVLFNKLVSKLPSLEKLYLSSCGELERIRIDSVSLNDLMVSGCRKLIEVMISAPKLACLHFTGFRSTTFFFSNDTPTKLRTIVELFRWGSNNASLFLWLREFLIRSQQCKICAPGLLPIHTGDLQDLREALPTLGKVLEIVYFEINSLEGDVLEFMDALFSFCHPKYVILDTWCTFDASHAAFTKFFSKKLGEQTYTECCTSHGQIKCWRHYLKDVEFGYTSILCRMDLWDLPVQWTSVLDGPTNSLKLTWYESGN